MAIQFENNKLYRMPIYFGPSLGPRQGPGGKLYQCADLEQRIIKITYRVDAALLAQYLPPFFFVDEPAEMSFTFSEYRNIEWLAGRGYNTLGVSAPVRFEGLNDVAVGELLFVLWENMADPIITGREELGFSKLFCDIPDFVEHNKQIKCAARWDNFEFVSFDSSSLGNCSIEEAYSRQTDGLLHYKYVPCTGKTTEADASYVTLTPADTPNLNIKSVQRMQDADLSINRASWEELPTLYHIVNAIADIERYENIGAYLIEATGGKDLSDQRILR